MNILGYCSKMLVSLVICPVFQTCCSTQFTMIFRTPDPSDWRPFGPVTHPPKKWRGTTKNFFPALCTGWVPLPLSCQTGAPTFKFVPTPLMSAIQNLDKLFVVRKIVLKLCQLVLVWLQSDPFHNLKPRVRGPLVTVQTSSATRDLTLIEQNKFC